MHIFVLEKQGCSSHSHWSCWAMYVYALWGVWFGVVGEGFPPVGMRKLYAMLSSGFTVPTQNFRKLFCKSYLFAYLSNCLSLSACLPTAYQSLSSIMQFKAICTMFTGELLSSCCPDLAKGHCLAHKLYDTSVCKCLFVSVRLRFLGMTRNNFLKNFPEPTEWCEIPLNAEPST